MRKIDVARGIDQIEFVGLAVPGGVVQGHRVGLDGDSALTLDVHRVEDLVPEVTIRHPATELNQPVGKGRLAVVDVGDDAKAPDVIQKFLQIRRRLRIIAENSPRI